MGMDRNTVIGFVLLGLLLFAYLFNSTKNSQELQRLKQLADDSIARVKAQQDALSKVQDSTKIKAVPVDTTGFNKATSGTEKLVSIENKTVKIIFSNKGAQPKEVLLKDFKSADGSMVK